MAYRALCKILSLFLMGLAIPLLLPFSIAAYCEWIAPPGHYPQTPCATAFLLTIVFTIAAGLLLRFFSRKGSSELYRREAFALVILVYILLSAVSALPFYFNKTLPHYVDAFFEMVSGYTTTGATILEGKHYDLHTKEEIPFTKTFSVGRQTNYSYYGTVKPILDPQTGVEVLSGIEALAPALLVWRSQTQFMGGGGIVILFLALLPILGVGGKVLYQTEATGPSKETMAPRIAETASKLWKLYVGLTLLQIVLLMFTNQNMPFFDALSISFSTLSTGGFSPKNASIAAYNCLSTELIVTVFMLVGSINFSIYFFLIRGKFQRLKDPELLAFFALVGGSALFATWMLGNQLLPFGQALREGVFQMVSAQTSTGFFTANFDVWPFALQTWMLILMFIGGMAGSTAGGMKVVRFLIIYRALANKLESVFRPEKVRSLRLGSLKLLDEKVVSTTLFFFIIVATFTVAGTFILVLDGLDPETSLTTIGCMLNNTGFGFRMASPLHSFAFLSDFGKIFSCFCMIAGRLEYFTLLVLIVPSFWRRA